MADDDRKFAFNGPQVGVAAFPNGNFNLESEGYKAPRATGSMSMNLDRDSSFRVGGTYQRGDTAEAPPNWGARVTYRMAF